MKAVVSSTYDPKYLFFLPIVTFCWRKLGVDVICFMPYLNGESDNRQIDCVNDAMRAAGLKPRYVGFDAPEHKQATYAQCARLYGACLDLPEDEIICTGDIDMAVFNLPFMKSAVIGQREFPWFEVIGSDLTPETQFPICYLSAPAERWRKVFDINGRTCQQCLDDLLGGIECENFRGNYWSKDQEEAFNRISKEPFFRKKERARPGTQFADNRYDRDDAFLLERLSPDTIDYHMPRPGYEDAAFSQILTVLKYHYPTDDFTWLTNYQQAYKQLL